jgi:hypothetical protein
MGEKLTRTQIKNLERFGGVNPADESFSRRQFAAQVGGFALAAGGAVVGGLWLRDRWGMEGVKPPPPVRLKNYSVILPVSRPSMVIVRSQPVRSEAHATKEEELKAREDQAFAMVKAALDAMGATNHAKMYGLYPKKGSIAPGFDADIVIWDPNRKEVIRQEIMHHGADYTPYEGLAVTGWPIMTILRGKLAMEEGKILGAPGDGAFLKRDLSPYAQSRRSA